MDKLHSSERFPELTIDIVRGLFAYDALTGNLTWKINRGRRAKAGDLAGTVDSHGYVTVTVGGRKVQAHRLAWFYVTGRWPEGKIHPKDNDKQNLAFGNWVEHASWLDDSVAATKRREQTSSWRRRELEKFRKAFPELTAAAEARAAQDAANRAARAERRIAMERARLLPGADTAPRQRLHRRS